MTPTAETPNSVAISRPIRMSGQAEPVSATAIAASKTPTLAATSFREQTQADRMLRSSARRRANRIRQKTLAASATSPTVPMSSAEGTSPPASLRATSARTPRPKRGHDDPLEQRAPGSPGRPPTDHVEAEAVHDGVAEHVSGIGDQRGRVREDARPDLGQEHRGVDPEDGPEHPPLALGDVSPDLAAVPHGADEGIAQARRRLLRSVQHSLWEPAPSLGDPLIRAIVAPCAT